MIILGILIGVLLFFYVRIAKKGIKSCIFILLLVIISLSFSSKSFIDVANAADEKDNGGQQEESSDKKKDSSSEEKKKKSGM